MFVNLVCICIVHISVLPVPQRQGPCHKDATKNICIFLCLWNTLCNLLKITPYTRSEIDFDDPHVQLSPSPCPGIWHTRVQQVLRNTSPAPELSTSGWVHSSTAEHTAHTAQHSCWAAVQWQLDQVYQAHEPQKTFLRLWCCSVAACWGDLPANSNSLRVLPSWLLSEAAAAKCSSVASWWELDIKCHWEALRQEQYQAEVFQAVCEASLWQKFTWKASPPLVLPLILLPPPQTTRCLPDLHWKLVLSDSSGVPLGSRSYPSCQWSHNQLAWWKGRGIDVKCQRTSFFASGIIASPKWLLIEQIRGHPTHPSSSYPTMSVWTMLRNTVARVIPLLDGLDKLLNYKVLK